MGSNFEKQTMTTKKKIKKIIFSFLLKPVWFDMSLIFFSMWDHFVLYKGDVTHDDLLQHF